MPADRETSNSPLINTLIAWLLAALVIFLITYFTKQYSEKGFWQNLLSGLHNTLFDILLIGVLIFWFNSRAEKRLEIQRYREQLDVWRGEGSPAAIRNNLVSIRRLNECGEQNMNLSDCVLERIDLSGLKLAGSNLSEAKCFETNFSATDLSQVILDKANLRRANLSKANLRHAKLRGTILQYANLEKADIRGADFSDAIVPNVTWTDAIYDDKTRFPHELDKSLMRQSGVFDSLRKSLSDE